VHLLLILNPHALLPHTPAVIPAHALEHATIPVLYHAIPGLAHHVKLQHLSRATAAHAPSPSAADASLPALAHTTLAASPPHPSFPVARYVAVVLAVVIISAQESATRANAGLVRSRRPFRVIAAKRRRKLLAGREKLKYARFWITVLRARGSGVTTAKISAIGMFLLPFPGVTYAHLSVDSLIVTLTAAKRPAIHLHALRLPVHVHPQYSLTAHVESISFLPTPHHFSLLGRNSPAPLAPHRCQLAPRYAKSRSQGATIHVV
jgi:hypothetical protein